MAAKETAAEMQYVLLTPTKSETHYLSRLKETVLEQTARPVEWVIIEGGTETDLQTVRAAFEGYDWVHVEGQRTFHDEGYSHVNFAQAVNEAYERAKAICDQRGVSFSFVGKTDATPTLPENYFEVLLAEMEKKPSLAIASGIERLEYKGRIIQKKSARKLAFTAVTDVRLYRRQFFEQVGGYPLTPSPDGNLVIKALNRGCQVKVVEDLAYLEQRLGGSKTGIWHGNKLRGAFMYEMGYHPVLFLLHSLRNAITEPPHYQVVPRVFGYGVSVISRTKKIDDEEIKEYYGRTRLKEVISAAFGKARRD